MFLSSKVNTESRQIRINQRICDREFIIDDGFLMKMINRMRSTLSKEMVH